MKATLQQIIKNVGDDTTLLDVQSVSGGSVSQAYRVQTKENIYFIKYNPNVPEDFFEKERDGLMRLKRSGAISVPTVYAHKESYIAMEWVSGARKKETETLLGRGLAELHQCTRDTFGLDVDNYIGKLPQPNNEEENWLTFYKKHRLGFQMELALKRDVLPKVRREKLERLLDSLHRFLPAHSVPSLLHGDLWGGNWITGDAGIPYFIDPAVFYGEREMELAFTELFGGFSQTFYDAYEEISPLPPEFEERKPLYQLYYLLVHLNLFGETYGPSVDRVLDYYVGSK
ncbi:fructosamine kinase family protein [Aliibacillus thermotolerans]|uniref:Fructosamine kinase family protein n=1 Tax=Aliibacillus thermotolerans TaxID=1834418 RepID=A0ABW0U4L3_9BACI|nr:fructosamine kinase family protein [Aliibacillus thermotolerans]MDA3128528.1 phosphotransferase [Aliibacillus thermotolerans]